MGGWVGGGHVWVGGWVGVGVMMVTMCMWSSVYWWEVGGCNCECVVVEESVRVCSDCISEDWCMLVCASVSASLCEWV